MKDYRSNTGPSPELRHIEEKAATKARQQEQHTMQSSFYQPFVQADMARVEIAARKRNWYLETAPDGSTALRVAMLEEAIKAIHVQLASSPAQTTGMASALEAARRIAEGV